MTPVTDQRWRMAGLAFLTQNFATGLTFGSFGAILLAIEARHQTTRTLSSLGLSLAIVSLSLLAPILGTALTKRISIRTSMAAGICLGALGYSLLALAPNIHTLLAIYLFIIGPSLVLFGNLPSNTLVATWFGARPGKAMGLVNMPILVMLTPLAAAAILNSFGLGAVFVAIAIAHLCILPCVLLVKDGPFALRGASVAPVGQDRLFVRPEFWLLAVACGIASGAGVMKMSHLAAIVIEQGYSVTLAVQLLAISGAAGLLGSPLFGWLADRIGGLRAMVLNVLIQAASFSILLAPIGPTALFLDAIVIGVCGAGVTPALGVIYARLFGPENYGRALGLMSFATLPFVFGMTPLASALFDVSGDYVAPIAAMTMLLIMAGGCFWGLHFRERRQSGAASVAPQGLGATLTAGPTHGD